MECEAADAVAGADASDCNPRRTVPLMQVDDRQLKDLWRPGCGTKAVFLDYDGTLREFEERPELAVPSQELKLLLSAINDRDDIRAHIVSGRDAKFLSANFSSFPRITLIAEHERRVKGRFQILRIGSQTWEGCESPKSGPSSPERNSCGGLSAGSQSGRNADEHKDWRHELRPALQSCVSQVAGSYVEEKASAMVWHYRGAEDQTAADAAASQLVETLARLRVQHDLHDVSVDFGHKIVEVACRTHTKGTVMRRICQDRAKHGEPFVAGLVAGDDVSDESMFELAQQGFLTIKVGRDATATRANYHVDGPEQLMSFLWHLLSS